MAHARAATKKARPADKIVSVRLPAAIRQRAKIHAATADKTFQAVVIEALDEYLKKRGA